MRSTALALRKATSKRKGSAVFSPAHPPIPTSHTLCDINAYNVLMKVLFGKLSRDEALEFSHIINAEAPEMASTLFDHSAVFPAPEVLRADPAGSSTYAKVIVREAKRKAYLKVDNSLSEVKLRKMTERRRAGGRRSKSSEVPPLFAQSSARMGDYNGFYNMLTRNGTMFTTAPPDPATYGDLAPLLAAGGTQHEESSRNPITPALIAKLRASLHKGSAVPSSEPANTPNEDGSYTPARDLFITCLYHSSGAASLTHDRVALMKMAFAMSPYQNAFLPPNMTRTPTMCRTDQGEVNDVPAFERFCISYVLETHKQHAGVYQRGWKSPANMAQSHISNRSSLTVTPDKIPILDLFLLFRGLSTGKDAEPPIKSVDRQVTVVELFSSGAGNVLRLLREGGCSDKEIENIATSKDPLGATLKSIQRMASSSSTTPDLRDSLGAYSSLFRSTRHAATTGVVVRPSVLTKKLRAPPPLWTPTLEERPYVKKRVGMEKLYRRTMFRLGRSVQSKSVAVSEEVDEAVKVIAAHERDTPLLPITPPPRKPYLGYMGGATVHNTNGNIQSNDGEERLCTEKPIDHVIGRSEQPISFQRYSDGMIRKQGSMIPMATTAPQGLMYRPPQTIPGVRIPAAKEASIVGRILDNARTTGAHVFDSSSQVMKEVAKKIKRKPSQRVKRYKSPTAPTGPRKSLMDFLVTSLTDKK